MQRINRTKTRKEEVQMLNVVGGEFSMDLQKLGDVSIGPVKIPLGSISAILLKIFGGIMCRVLCSSMGLKIN